MRLAIALLAAAIASSSAAAQSTLAGIGQAINNLKPGAAGAGGAGCSGGVTLLGQTSDAVRGVHGLVGDHPWLSAFNKAKAQAEPLYGRRSQATELAGRLQSQIQRASEQGGDVTGLVAQLAAAQQEIAAAQAALMPLEIEATQLNEWANQLCG